MQKSVVGRWVLVLISMSCLIRPTTIGAAEIETKLALPLFLKMVSYDESFAAQKKPDTLRLYFLYGFSDSKSYQQYQEATEYFRTAGGLSVSGVPVKLIGVQRSDADSVIASGPDSSYSIIVCATGRGREFQELESTLKRKNCHSFAIDCGDLAAGVSVSVEAKEFKTAIVVNLRSAIAEGSRFGARFLSMCKILDRPS